VCICNTGTLGRLEEIVLYRESLTFRRQAIQDRLEELEIMLNRVEPVFQEFPLMKKYVDEIEALRGELEAIDDLMANQGRVQGAWERETRRLE